MRVIAHIRAGGLVGASESLGWYITNSLNIIDIAGVVIALRCSSHSAKAAGVAPGGANAPNACEEQPAA
ncbi:MAG TPA: hypothetical protein VGJ20_23670 [Xanthobacteraceae bacterium]|jgi:hypothetical protein